MSEIALRVEGLGKRYRIGVEQGGVHRYKSLRDSLGGVARRPVQALRSAAIRPPMNESNSFWALQDINFEVKRGEVIGIIGRNGAGKSTLLKILSRITKPTVGHVALYGRVGSLLEVGTGFHPELTGRENVFLNGAILGMTSAEVKSRFDEIVAFSEIERFLDTPVKHYSSGMYMRLAFAVAAHLEPEILVVDEVLAVGDAEFQKKCLGKMKDVAREGRTVLFVSHNMAAIENLCQSGLMLAGGQTVEEGSADDVVKRYRMETSFIRRDGSSLSKRSDRSGNGIVRLTSFHIEDSGGQIVESVASGQDVIFVLGFQHNGTAQGGSVDVGVSISNSQDQSLSVLYSSYQNHKFADLPRSGQFRCRIGRLCLACGRYTLGARVIIGMDEADWPRDGVGEFDVDAGDFWGTGHRGFDGNAPLLLDGAWSMTDSNAAQTSN